MPYTLMGELGLDFRRTDMVKLMHGRADILCANPYIG